MRSEPGKPSGWDKIIVFIAEGFGAGRVPFAPGTFGTVVGFGWIYLLLLPQCIWIYLGGIVGGFFAAIWVGARAEKVLGKKDPGSIVIDEIAALPLAFLPAVLWSLKKGTPEPFSFFWSGANILLPVAAFLAFRFFDIAKPFGIRRVQDLPGGWGLVLDDFLAALAATMPVSAALAVLPLFAE
jgi:phosphatidylglycerophosphatase A